MEGIIEVEANGALHGQVTLSGAKNAVLVIMAATILNRGVNTLYNVPASSDVYTMMQILTELGAQVLFHEQARTLIIDSSTISRYQVSPELMRKLRASVLVLGPLLARFGKAQLALSGGCKLTIDGARPINYHITHLQRMGAMIEVIGDAINACTHGLRATTCVLDYPSVGATENIIMASVLTTGVTTIINAALEPEVLDFITMLRGMGACIEIEAPATIRITGVSTLHATQHTIMVDRLEAGALLCAAAITGGNITISNARADHLGIVLFKLEQMGHQVAITETNGVSFRATKCPVAVSIKTGPYPQFPTDLQAMMLTLQTVAEGVSTIEETVYNNRLTHVDQLQRMGADIQIFSSSMVRITGVPELQGTFVEASDIRASCALVLAGLVAKGSTHIKGLHYLQRAYDGIMQKLMSLGANIRTQSIDVSTSSPKQIIAV